jgi:hypothetical protein
MELNIVLVVVFVLPVLCWAVAFLAVVKYMFVADEQLTIAC